MKHKNTAWFLFSLAMLLCAVPASVSAGSGKLRNSLLGNLVRLPHFRKGGFLQEFKPRNMQEDTDAVILVHGLFMNGHQMSFLAYKLHKLHYYCLTYDYPTRLKDITGHGEDFRKVLENFCRQNPKRKIHIITHSMGGLITRQAVANLPEKIRKNIKSILMLAPPNQGSQVADLVYKHLTKLCSYFPPVVGMQSHEKSECRTLPGIPEEIRLGIIAASHDILVPVDSTRLPGMDHFMIMEIQTHTSLPFSPKVYKKIRTFLQGAEEDPEK